MRFWWEFSCIFVWKQLGSDCDEIFHVFSSRSNWKVIVDENFNVFSSRSRFFVRRRMVWDFNENFHVFSSGSMIVVRFFVRRRMVWDFDENFVGRRMAWDFEWEFSCTFVWKQLGNDYGFFMYFCLEAIGKWLWWEF